MTAGDSLGGQIVINHIGSQAKPLMEIGDVQFMQGF